MSDARNVYPRLCWGCLGIIADHAHDHANLNYGGVCDQCAKNNVGELPGLRVALQGYTELMNTVIEQDALYLIIQTLHTS